MGSSSGARYNGTTGLFIDVFVTQQSGGLDRPTFVIFQEPRIANIPTLSEWGLIAMAAALGIAGIVAYRRRIVA